MFKNMKKRILFLCLTLAMLFTGIAQFAPLDEKTEPLQVEAAVQSGKVSLTKLRGTLGISSIGRPASEGLWGFRVSGSRAFCLNTGKSMNNGDSVSAKTYNAVTYSNKGIARGLTYFFKKMNTNSTHDIALMQAYIWACGKGTSKSTAVYQAGKYVESGYTMSKAKKFCEAISETYPEGTIYYYKVTHCVSGKSLSGHQVLLGYSTDLFEHPEKDKVDATESLEGSENISLTINKKDQETGIGLGGAVFEIRCDGTRVGTATTDNAGNATFNYTRRYKTSPKTSEKYVYVTNWKQLTYKQQKECTQKGWYKSKSKAKSVAKKEARKKAQAELNSLKKANHTWTVTEITPPKGHALSKERTKTLTESGSRTSFTYAFSNPHRKVNISLRKVSSSQNVGKEATLQGAVYEVRAAEPILNSANQVVLQKDGLAGTMVTNSQGTASITGLNAGKYYVKEVKASKGYNLDTKIYQVDGNTSDNTQITVNKSVTSTEPLIEATVKIVKSKGQQGVPEANATFDVLDSAGNVVDRITTGTDGVGTTTKKLPYGSYTVRQTGGEPGYVFSPDYTVRVDNNREITLDIVNEQKKPGRIIIMKNTYTLFDGDEIRRPEKDARFEVKNAEGRTVATIRTDKNGYGESKELEPGIYTIHQVAGEENFRFVDDFQVEIKEGDIDAHTYTLDNPTTSDAVAVKKTKSRNGEITPEEGAAFAVIDLSKAEAPTEKDLTDSDTRTAYVNSLEKGAVYDTIYTDENGDAAFLLEKWEGNEEGILLLQTSGTFGYELCAPYYTKDHEPKEVNGITTYEYVADDPYTEWAKIDLTKTMTVSMDKSQPVTGPEANAEFEIYDYENKLVTTFITDENGYAESPRLDYGSYTLKQVSGAASHILMEPVDFYLTKQERHQTFHLGTFNNEAKDVEFELTKISSETSILLNDAAYEISDYSGDVIATIMTGSEGEEKGKATVTLPYGKYTIKEINAPEGFQTDKETHEFELNIKSVKYDEDGNGSYQMTVEDKPIYGEIGITKTGKILTGYNDDETQFAYEDGPVAGAVYGLYAKEDILLDDGSVVWKAGTKIDEKTTDADGKIQFTRKLKDGTETTEFYLGSYYVQEISAPTGYVLDTEQHEVVLTWDATASDVNTFEPLEPIPDVDDPLGNNDDGANSGPAILMQGKKLNEVFLNWEEENGEDINRILFTYYDPEDTYYDYDIDVSESQNRSVMMAIDGGEAYIRPAQAGKIIHFNGSSSYMFSGLDELYEIDLDNVDTADVVDGSYMFQKCINLEELDLSNFNTKSLQNAARMFYDCRSLKTIYVLKARFDKVEGSEQYQEPEIVSMRVEPNRDFEIGETLTVEDFTFTATYADDSEQVVYLLEDEATFKPKTAYAAGTIPVEAHMAGRYAAYGILNTDIEVLDSETDETEVVKAEKAEVTLELEDEIQTVTITAVKKDADDGTKLEGAEFALRAATDIVDNAGNIIFHKGDVIGRETSSSAGSMGEDFEGLSFGSLPTNAYAKDPDAQYMYEIYETKPPKGYKLSTQVFQFSGTPENNSELSFEHEVDVANELSEYVSIWKSWANFDPEDIPNSIEVEATNKNTNEKKTFTLTADGGWWCETDILKTDINNWTFKETKMDPEVEDVSVDIHVYDNQDPFTPGVVQMDNYTDSVNVWLEIRKKWDDGDNCDQIRPTSIKVRLLADGIRQETVTLNADNNWTYRTSPLPKTDDYGNEIEYTWEEVPTDIINGNKETGYKSTVGIPDEDGDGSVEVTVMTNTHTPAKTEATVTKVWDDDSNKDNIRPVSIKATLFRNGEEVRTVTLREENDWTFTVKNLQKNDENGTPYEYTWKEEDAEFIDNADSLGDIGYMPIYKVEGTKTTITNRHKMPLGSVNVTKRLDPARMDFSNGDPAFTFVLEGTDVYGNEVHQEQTLTFTKTDQASGGRDSDGYITKKAVFTNLRYGSYKLYEKDPSGYLYYLDHVDCKYNAASEDGMEVTIDHQEYKPDIDGDKSSYDSWQADAVFTNEPLRGSIKLIKQDSGRPLQGVEFVITNEAGDTIATKTTDENGEIYIDKLKPGKYTVTETKTVEGHNLLTEPFTITLPFIITDKEAQEQKVDTTDAIYHASDKSWYFYDLTYVVENKVTLDLPKTGGIMTYLPIAAAVILLSVGGYYLTKKKKKPKESAR